MNTKLLRSVCYSVIFFGFIAAVLFRIEAVNTERSSMKNTFSGEWNEFGKPVVVEKIKKEDVSIIERMTVLKTGKDRLEAFVTGDIRRKLKVGQKFNSENDKGVYGNITWIDKKVNLDNGLYKIKFKNSIALKNHDKMLIPVDIEIKKYKNVLAIPIKALATEGQLAFVWKVNGENVERVPIRYEEKNSEKVIVRKGAQVGEKIVIKGQKSLVSGQKIRTIK